MLYNSANFTNKDGKNIFAIVITQAVSGGSSELTTRNRCEIDSEKKEYGENVNGYTLLTYVEGVLTDKVNVSTVYRSLADNSIKAFDRWLYFESEAERDSYISTNLS